MIKNCGTSIRSFLCIVEIFVLILIEQAIVGLFLK